MLIGSIDRSSSNDPALPIRPGFIYFSAVDTEVKVLLRLVPRLVTAMTIAIEMPAAIRPYSMAVAPDRSQKKRRSCDMEGSLTVAQMNDGRRASVWLGCTHEA
jgi:hypothetical protein